MPTMASSAGAPSHSLLNKGMDRGRGKGWVPPKASSSSFLGLSSGPCSHLPPRAPHSLSFCSKDSVSHAGVESRATTSWHHPHCICPKPKAYRLVHWWLSSRLLPSSEFLGHVPSLTTLWAILRQCLSSSPSHHAVPGSSNRD